MSFNISQEATATVNELFYRHGPVPAALRPNPKDMARAREILERVLREAFDAGRLSAQTEWPLGTRVRKLAGASWRGCIVGYYSTALTPEGYCVESEREPGSVQLYPRSALELVETD